MSETKRVLNFGSLNIDYVYCVDHLVRPGETIHSTGLEVYSGGKGLNQSVALAKAGAVVFHSGCVGAADGRLLVDELTAAGVNTDHIRFTDVRSGNAIIQVDINGENSIVLFGGANRQCTEEQIKNTLKAFGPGDILLFQNETNLVDALITTGADLGLTVVFNPAPCDGLVKQYPLELVDIFIVNEVEAGELTGMGKSGADLMMAAMRKAFPKAGIVLTLGERGAIYFDGEEEYRQKAFKADVVDTTAAGDAFIGYFLAGYAKGEPSAEIIRTAAKAAAITVSKAGAARSIPAITSVI